MLIVRRDALRGVERVLLPGHHSGPFPGSLCLAAVFSAARSRSDRGRVEGARRAVRGFRLVRAGGFTGGAERGKGNSPGRMGRVHRTRSPGTRPYPPTVSGRREDGRPHAFRGRRSARPKAAPLFAGPGPAVVPAPRGDRHRSTAGGLFWPGGWVGSLVGGRRGVGGQRLSSPRWTVVRPCRRASPPRPRRRRQGRRHGIVGIVGVACCSPSGRCR